MKKFIIVNSAINQQLSWCWNFKLVSKIVINSIIDEQIVIDIKQFDNKKNKIPFLAQFDASWIRIFFNDETYIDLVSAEIFAIGSKSGILINLLGDCHEFNDEFVSLRIAKYAKNKGLTKVSRNVEFSYRSHMGRKIKSKIKEIMKIKSNILIDKFKYASERKKILKRAIELFVEKIYVEENWANIIGRVSLELDRLYDE